MKKIINISLSISLFAIFAISFNTKALTLDDIYFLLNSEIINPTQASMLMQNSYMFGGPIPSNEVAQKTVMKDVIASCVDISLNIKYSDRDSEFNNNSVTLLQTFLNKNDYLPVEPTGYFGELTLIGVKAFQAVNGIEPTGYVGPETRTKIKNVDCDNVDIPTTGVSTDPANPPIPNKPDSLPPFLTLTATPIKIFVNDYTTLSWSANNAIDKCTLKSKDIDGRILNATVDYLGSTQVGPLGKPTTYTLVCYNKYGIPGSKSVDITTMPLIAAPSSEQGYIKSSYLTSVSPASGNRGDVVTIQGTGFLPTNEVIFDGVKVNKNLIKEETSTSISFIVPQYVECPSGYCPIPTQDTKNETGGKKVIQVSNANGFSNDAFFTLPSKIIITKGVPTIPNFASTLSISSSTPTSGYRGDTVTLTGTGFANDSVVMFGGYRVPSNFITSKSNEIIYFTVPPFQLGCTDPELELCPRLPIYGSGTVIETGGDKSITVINTNSKSTTTSVMFSLPSKKVTY